MLEVLPVIALLQNNLNMSRKSSFNLDRFYEGLQRVESSLGKTDFRKTVNSPLVKETLREDKARPLAVFKRELNRKELAKTKINLDMPYDQIRPARQEHRQEPKPTNYRFSELSAESRETDPYSNVRQRLQGWRKEESEQGREAVSSGNSKVIQKSEIDESQYYDFLEKTMETPANEQQADAASGAVGGGSGWVQEQLLGELTRRNEVYERVEAECRQERSYYRKNEDLSIRLQDHFRKHRTMHNIIQEFKRLYEIKGTDLQELYHCLQANRQKEEEALL